MIIVVDSSILCQDLRFAGSASRVFFGNLRVVPATLLLPEVVVDEAVNIFRERLIAAQAAINKANRELSQLVDRTVSMANAVDLEQEVLKYRKLLLSRIAEAGGKTIPYPKIAHEKVVQRELQRRKPFKPNGSGYRDFLIWESVRAQALSGHERVAFATANTRDFASGQRLHEDLSSEVLNPQRIELFTSLRDFNEKHILPRLETVDQFDRKLQNASGGEPRVASWIQEHLLGILQDEEFGYMLVGVPAGRFWASEIASFDDMEVVSTKKLQSNELVCEVKVQASVEVSIDIDREDYDNYQEVRSWLGGPNFGSWHEVFQLQINMEITIDAETSQVTSHGVSMVEPV
jgi:hypothetical protein